MAVRVFTDNPGALLSAIYREIDRGNIDTWSYDKDGDLTHTPPQWAHKAWFHPRALEGRLVLNAIRPKGRTITSEVYAVYHGRLIEMLLAHFDSRFTTASATALPTSDDET